MTWPSTVFVLGPIHCVTPPRSFNFVLDVFFNLTTILHPQCLAFERLAFCWLTTSNGVFPSFEVSAFVSIRFLTQTEYWSAYGHSFFGNPVSVNIAQARSTTV